MNEPVHGRPAARLAGPAQDLSDFSRDFGCACELAFDLSRSIACARDRYLDRDNYRQVVLDFGLGRALDRACTLAFDLGLALVLVCDPSDRDRDLARARTLADSLVRALARARDRARDRDLARDLELDFDCAISLARVLGNLSERALLLGGAGRPGGRVVLSAVRLLAAAVWLLPAGERARYREEFSSELWDIAQAHEGRCQQLQYVGCQIVRLVQLRAAVLAPRRRGASP